MIFTTQVHVKEDSSETWFHVLSIPVLPLTSEPDICDQNTLVKLSGSFFIRVAARNLAGLGATSELRVTLVG